MDGITSMTSTRDFGPVQPFIAVGHNLAGVGTTASVDFRGVASGMIVHDVYTVVSFFFVTTAAASANASVTLTGGPFFQVTVFNPSGGTIYVNLNAAAVLPVAGTTAGSFPLLAGAFRTFGFLTNTVQVRDSLAAGGVDVHITAFR